MLVTKNVLSLCKKDLIEIYRHAVASVKPDNLIKKFLKFENERLIFRDPLNPSNSLDYPLQDVKIHVLGGGKCVLGMATALGDIVKEANLQHKFSFGSISVPLDLKAPFDESSQRRLDAVHVDCLFGSKDNLPDEGSVVATQHILRKIADATKSDDDNGLQSLFLILLSGGGSACLTSPRHLDLEQKLDLMRRLVQEGADIVELNSVRRYYSNVKGGRLARHILKSNPKSRVISLIISDVIGDPIEFIASGPTCVPSNVHSDEFYLSMRRVLQKYGLEVPVEVSDTQDSDMIAISNDAVQNKILGNNLVALQSAREKAQSMGYQVYLLDGFLEGSTTDAVKRLISFSDQHLPKFNERIICMAGGETTVRRLENETWGTGGRVQEMCLDYMISGLIEDRDFKHDNIDLMLAASTDGQDGPTDAAACMASLAEYSMMHNDEKSFDLKDCNQAKVSHNSYSFWTAVKPEWLVKTGLTGTNVMDIYFHLMVPRPSRSKLLSVDDASTK